MSLADLAQQVRGRERSSVELVRLALDRIAALDAGLNAVVRTCPEEAFASARALDARVAAGEDPGPLSGLPLLVKDTEDAAGLPTSHGSRLFADAEPAQVDADDVGRLRAAGAIVLGKTNVPEFAFEGFTANDVFGVTRNPWAPDWSPGGSSGGSAVALTTGMVPLATATDGGGSVRIPAAFCGLVGLKPSYGMLGRDPIPSSIDTSTKGILATTVEDARLLLDVLRGPAPGDPNAVPTWSPRLRPWPARLLIADRLVAYGSLHAEIHERFGQAVLALADALDLDPQHVPPPFDPGIDDTWFRLVGVEELTFLGRARFEREAALLTSYVRRGYGAAASIGIDGYVAARRERFAYTRALDVLLDGDTLLVSPTMAVDGFRADDETLTPNDAYNTQVANITGHPALSVPAGRCSNGVPFGLQLMAGRFAEDLLLAAGEAWEAARPWPLAATGYQPFPGLAPAGTPPAGDTPRV